MLTLTYEETCPRTWRVAVRFLSPSREEKHLWIDTHDWQGKSLILFKHSFPTRKYGFLPSPLHLPFTRRGSASAFLLVFLSLGKTQKIPSFAHGPHRKEEANRKEEEKTMLLSLQYLTSPQATSEVHTVQFALFTLHLFLFFSLKERALPFPSKLNDPRRLPGTPQWKGARLPKTIHRTLHPTRFNGRKALNCGRERKQRVTLSIPLIHLHLV